IPDRRRHLRPVADDPGVGQQTLDVVRPVSGNAGDVEALEGAPVPLATAQYRVPAQAGLRALQGQQLEQPRVVMQRDAPLLVVVAHHDVVVGPVADPCAAGETWGHTISLNSSLSTGSMLLWFYGLEQPAMTSYLKEAAAAPFSAGRDRCSAGRRGPPGPSA